MRSLWHIRPRGFTVHWKSCNSKRRTRSLSMGRGRVGRGRCPNGAIRGRPRANTTPSGTTCVLHSTDYHMRRKASPNLTCLEPTTFDPQGRTLISIHLMLAAEQLRRPTLTLAKLWVELQIQTRGNTPPQRMVRPRGL